MNISKVIFCNVIECFTGEYNYIHLKGSIEIFCNSDIPDINQE